MGVRGCDGSGRTLRSKGIHMLILQRPQQSPGRQKAGPALLPSAASRRLDLVYMRLMKKEGIKGGLLTPDA